MTKLARYLTAAALTLAAILVLDPSGQIPLGALRGAGLLTDLACVTCGAAGVSALLSGGTIAVLLWTQSSFLAASTCLALCTAALTT